ncbi:MAG: hypothetical protein AAB649_04805 [Patescibacteria group bacterium]
MADNSSKKKQGGLYNVSDFSAAVQGTPEIINAERIKQSLLQLAQARVSNPNYGAKKMSDGTKIAIALIVTLGVVAVGVAFANR